LDEDPDWNAQHCANHAIYVNASFPSYSRIVETVRMATPRSYEFSLSSERFKRFTRSSSQ